MDDEEDDGMDNDMEYELNDAMEDIEEARKASESRRRCRYDGKDRR